MPRSAETYSTTPFARILTAFMWSKTPPWTPSKVAAVLGISRSRVSNWVYKDIMPDIDTMLVVMARLNIPITALLQAYAEQGLPMPPLTVEEAKERQSGTGGTSGAGGIAQPRPAPEPRERRSAPTTASTTTPVPHGRYGLRAVNRPPEPPSQPAAAQLPYDDETPDAAEVTRQPDTWAKMVAHTRKVMAMAGMPPAALEAMLAEIEEAQGAQRPTTTNDADGERQRPSGPHPAQPSAK